MTWKWHNNYCPVKVKFFENIGQLHELKPNKNILIEKVEKKQTLTTHLFFEGCFKLIFNTYTKNFENYLKFLLSQIFWCIS